MKWLKFNHLKSRIGLRHGVVTRQGGVSEGMFGSMNLSFNSGDLLKNVQCNRTRVAEGFNLTVDKLYFPDQCHTSNVSWVDGDSTKFTETDALITKERNIAIGVLSADCVPILFYDPINKVIAAAHAGWRGTVAGIVSNVVAEMIGVGGCSVKDILVGIGPSIQQANYEVGEEVCQHVHALEHIDANQIFKPSLKKGHYLLDLQELNKQLLEHAGVSSTHIETMNFCTFENKELFFSARRDGFHSGRFGAVIMLQ